MSANAIWQSLTLLVSKLLRRIFIKNSLICSFICAYVFRQFLFSPYLGTVLFELAGKLPLMLSVRKITKIEAKSDTYVRYRPAGDGRQWALQALLPSSRWAPFCGRDVVGMSTATELRWGFRFWCLVRAWNYNLTLVSDLRSQPCWWTVTMISMLLLWVVMSSLALNMEAECSSETLAYAYKFTRCYGPEHEHQFMDFWELQM